MSEQRNRVKVQHIRSNQSENVAYESASLKFPKLPTAEKLSDGEIAVNYGADVETLSLKNSENEIVRFVNEKELNEVSEVSAAAITELNEKIGLSQPKRVRFKIGADEEVTCDTTFNELRALLPSSNGNEVHCIIPLLNINTGDQTFVNVTGDMVGFGPHNIDFAFSVPMSSTVSWGNNAIVAVREVVVRVTDSAVTPAYIAKNEYNYESMVVNCENTGEDAYRINSAFVKIREEYRFGHKIVLMYQSSEQTVSAYNIGSVYMDETESEIVGFRFVAPTDEGIDWFYIYKDENEVEHIEHGTYLTYPLVAVFNAPSVQGQDIRCNVTTAEIVTALQLYRPVVGLWADRISRCYRMLLPAFNSDIASQNFAFTSVGPNDILVVSFNTETSKWERKVYPLFKEIDEAPTEGSANPVSSGGVYDKLSDYSLVISAAVNDLNDRINQTSVEMDELQPKRMVVNFTTTADEEVLTCEQEPIEIATAYAEGREVVARVDDGSRIYRLASSNGMTFVYENSETLMSEIAYDNANSTWVKTVYDWDSEPTENSTNLLPSWSVYNALQDKQDTLTFDDEPTEDSDNPVKSGGVYDRMERDSLVISAALNDLNDRLGNVETDIEGKQDTLTFDNAPTANSTNPVTSGGVYSAIADSEEVVEGILLSDGFHPCEWVNDSFVPTHETINGEVGVLYLDVDTHKLYHINANDLALARFTYQEIGPSTVNSVIENSNLAVTSGGVYDKFAEYSLAISAALNELNDKVAALEEDNIVLKAEVERLKAANQNP